MMKLTLAYAPVSCARIVQVALEAVGADYDLRLVNLAEGGQYAPDYLAFNPKGKVPALRVDEVILTETPAILTWLARSYPDAGLLPFDGVPLGDAAILSDLSYLAGTLHPLTTRVCRAAFFCDLPGGAENVVALALPAVRLNLALIEARLRQGRWWYGDRWSAIDPYLEWIHYRIASTAIDLSPYPALAAHSTATAARPEFVRAAERAAAALASG